MRTWVVSFAVAICVFSSAAYAQSSYQVSGVQIEGNARVDSEAIKLQLKTGPGSVSSDDISADVKQLYKTGFFDQVSASIVTDGGKRFLKYSLIEKPVVRRVFIKGNENVDESDLSEAINFGAQRFLDKAKIQGAIRRASSYYQTRGYYDVSFDYSVVPVGDNQVDLTFNVTEGERFKIRNIRVNGLDKMDESDLLDTIQTSEYSWWSSWLLGTGRLNLEMLQNDRQLMRQFFVDHGFIDATVSEPSVERTDDGLDISFDVFEGKEYTIGAIGAAGDLIEDSEALTVEGIESETGEVFSASTVRADSFVISDKFSDRGYAFANVVPDTKINREAGTIDLNFRTDKGKLVSINKVIIRGNEKTYDNVIRREIRVGEKEQYDGTKVKRSQQILQRIGLFEEVNITTEPTDKDDEVDLLVNVREGSTGTFSAGAGFSSSDGALFNIRVSENNLFGTGKNVTANVDFGTERDNLILSYNDRRFNDTHWAMGVDLLKTEREFSDFDRDLQGAALEAGYPLEELFPESSILKDVTFSVKYEYLDIDIDNVDDDAAQLVKDSEGSSSSSGFTPKFTRNTINNPLNPTDGSRQVLSFEFTGFGGNEEFWLFDARNQWYEPLIEFDEASELVFSWRTRFSYGETYDTDDAFPLFRRFFPGGINSVRGYEARTLGPKDANGNEFGGSKQLVNNWELIFPLVPSAGLRGVAFFDAGEAYDDDESMDLGELRLAYGGGIRWQSPLGPIRVEVGFPIDREAGEDSVVTLFSFGAPL